MSLGISSGIAVSGQSVVIDDASATIKYICQAPAGSATSSAVWQILRIDTGTANQTIIKYADGNKNYDNVADNRASLSYS